MDRKEKVLAYIKSESYVPLKAGELAAVLGVPETDREELERILEELTEESRIYLTKKKRYMCVEKDKEPVSGVLHCNAKGFFGFVICDDASEDVYVAGDKMKDAFDGDRVLVGVDCEKSGGKREGHVIKITERGNKTVVGVVEKKKNGTYRIKSDNRRIYTNIRVQSEDMMCAKIGSRVSCEITEYTENGKMYGRVTAVLGSSDSLKSCIEGIILSNGIKQVFDEETLSEAENAPSAVGGADIKDRADLRDMLVFTIDGDDARDFDDAVSLSVLQNGNYYLGVHIADVTHYVRQGTALDREAFERATSVYLADRVIPMLPEKLSNGICSLNPNEDRLALTVFMEIDRNGGVVSHKIEKTVIRSKERMTYNKVNLILEQSDKELIAKYRNIVPTLRLMAELAEILRQKRDKRGAIQFDFPETGIVVDKDGEPVEIVKRVRGTSEKLIEEFMLLANETVAEYAYWAELPFVYRVHEPPGTDKITAFNDFIRNFNLSVKGKIDENNPIHPKALQKILDCVKDTPEERMVATNMLHSLMKAEYKTENLGHFGLAAKYYCHFTSPIRRYPDLTIHRILKTFLAGGKINTDVYAAASHSSEREVAAEHTERDVEDLMKTAYMSGFLGEAFDAVVSGVTGFGMFAELENGVEGLIRIENMRGDYFELDEAANALAGGGTGRVYRVGDSVRVVLAKTDLMLRRIDFVLEEDAEPELLHKISKSGSRKKQIKRTDSKKRYKYTKRKKKK